MHRQPESADKLDFILKFNLSHKLQLLNVQCNFCSVMCYTVLIWTPVLLTLWNNILLQSFNSPKRVHCIPTDKINASIRIRRVLKVKICIGRMQILTSFVTSLLKTLGDHQLNDTNLGNSRVPVCVLVLPNTGEVHTCDAWQGRSDGQGWTARTHRTAAAGRDWHNRFVAESLFA